MTYLNESPFKYYISILGDGGSEAMLILLIFRGDGGSRIGEDLLI